jgi:hypothetical protein
MAGVPAESPWPTGSILFRTETLRHQGQVSWGFYSESSTAGRTIAGRTMGHSCSQSMQRQYVRTMPGRGRAVYTGNVHWDASHFGQHGRSAIGVQNANGSPPTITVFPEDFVEEGFVRSPAWSRVGHNRLSIETHQLSANYFRTLDAVFR